MENYKNGGNLETSQLWLRRDFVGGNVENEIHILIHFLVRLKPQILNLKLW